MTAFVIRKKKKREKERKVSRLSSMRPLINLKANAIYCRVCKTLNAKKSTVLTFVKNTGHTSIEDNVQPTVAYVTCLTTIYLTK